MSREYESFPTTEAAYNWGYWIGYIAPAVDEHPAPPKDWTTKRGAYRRGIWDGWQTHKRLSAELHERRQALWDARRLLEDVDDVEEGEVEVLADRLTREPRRDRRNTRKDP